MKKLLILLILVSSPSFAALSDFKGRYEVVTGKDGTYGCFDYEILLEEGPSLKIIDPFTNYVVDEFPSINKGTVAWRFDWGDGVKKGKQTNVFDGKYKLTHEVRTFFNTFIYKRTELTLEGKILTILRMTRDSEKTCVLKKI